MEVDASPTGEVSSDEQDVVLGEESGAERSDPTQLLDLNDCDEPKGSHTSPRPCVFFYKQRISSFTDRKGCD